MKMQDGLKNQCRFLTENAIGHLSLVEVVRHGV